ncbi:hypothetical protein [uncultured Bacteroides sp.]|uniref:hypothetical protein n=1 Tax=uncultured Bacteroides sp. TaxID=162156 RepID=UPI0023BD21EF|nr:hypothetical protein [uncultured Bacteroides sp.]MDE5702659.1 hypothetical protein [Bacteroides sp.]
MKKHILTLSVALCLAFAGSVSAQNFLPDTLLFVFKLHGQTRKYEMSFRMEHDSLRLYWGIERNLKWQSGSYTVTPEALGRGTRLSFLQPEDGRHVNLVPEETAYFLSRTAYRQLKEHHSFVYNQTTYFLFKEEENEGFPLLHVKDATEGGEMWILDYPQLPLVWRMKNNPLEINWEVNR